MIIKWNTVSRAMFLVGGIITTFLFPGCKPTDQQPTFAINGLTMNDVHKITTTGFEIQGLEGFDSKIISNVVSIFLPDGDRQSGPGMVISIEDFEEIVDLQTAVNSLIRNEPGYTFINRKEVEINHVEGCSLDFTSIYRAPDGIILSNPGASEGDIIRGRVVLAVVDGNRLFKCLMLAPDSLWERYEPAFNKVLLTVRFVH